MHHIQRMHNPGYFNPKPRRTFRNVAALLASLVIAAPAHSEILSYIHPPISRQTSVEKPENAPDPGKPVADHTAQNSEADGAVEFRTRLVKDEDGLSIMLIYRDRSGRETGLPVPLPPTAGRQLGTFIGPERTVIFTENAILLVQGYNSCFRGELFVPMEDRESMSSTLMVSLPQVSSGSNLRSFIRSSGESGDFVYFLDSSGTVRSRDTRFISNAFSAATIPIEEETRLVSAMGYAVAYTLGSNVVHVLLGTRAPRMLVEPIILPEPVSSEPRAFPSACGIFLVIGSSTFLVSGPLKEQPSFSVVAID